MSARSVIGHVTGGRSLASGLMRPMIVIVLDVFCEDLGQMLLAEDQHLVGHLTAERSGNRLADRVRPGACGGVLMIRTPSARKTSSKAATNLVSRSRIKNRSDPIPIYQLHGQVPGLLSHPRPGRVWR